MDDIEIPHSLGKIASLFKIILNTRWLALLFLICALPTGIRLALLTPMGQVADEPAHIARADGLLYGQIVGHRSTFTDPSTHVVQNVSGVLVNQSIITASLIELAPGPARPLSVSRRHKAKALKWASQIGYDICPNTVQYFPFFYLPGSVGIALAHVIGQSPVNSLFAGRLGMLASYIIMGFAALVFAAWGRPILFTVLTLPMALSLGASFNQDGQLIAATTLVGALLTRDAVLQPKLRLLAVIVFILVICSKPPYGLLLFAAAVPLSALGLIRRFGGLALFAIPPLIWVAVMARVSLVPYYKAPYHPGPLWPGSRSILLDTTNVQDNLLVLLAHPADIILLPWQFLELYWSNILLSAIGVLGWLQIQLHGWQYHGWELAISAAFVAGLAARSAHQVKAADAVFILSLIVASIVAMELALYLSWTNVGNAVIEGPSGRYYLLFLPFLILALPRWGGKIGNLFKFKGSAALIEFILTIPAILMAALDIVYLPDIIARIFHT